VGIDNLSDLNTRKKLNEDLGLEVNKSLNATSEATLIWIKFFPKFSTIFKERKNFKKEEAIYYKEMGNLFDKAFKFSANLDNLLKNSNFLKEKFEKNQGKNFDNLKNIYLYFNEINILSNKFLILVNKIFLFF
jgi:hypothetical protein